MKMYKLSFIFNIIFTHSLSVITTCLIRCKCSVLVYGHAATAAAGGAVREGVLGQVAALRAQGDWAGGLGRLPEGVVHAGATLQAAAVVTVNICHIHHHHFRHCHGHCPCPCPSPGPCPYGLRPSSVNLHPPAANPAPPAANPAPDPQLHSAPPHAATTPAARLSAATTPAHPLAAANPATNLRHLPSNLA